MIEITQINNPHLDDKVIDACSIFGMMMCVNLLIALITPPMGGCLFAAMIVGKIDFIKLIKAIWPFIIAELIVLVMIIYIPEITLFVPRLLGFI